jgi:hypothetical protein
MEKQEFTEKTAKWLESFLSQKFAETHDVLDVIIPESNLSKIQNGSIKLCHNYSSWEFKPDVFAILKDKRTNEIELVLVNRSIGSISLKEIGELYCYSKLANSKLSFLVSLNGVSSEVGILLLDENIKKRLLNYGDGKEIIILSWDKKGDTAKPSSNIYK